MESNHNGKALPIRTCFSFTPNIDEIKNQLDDIHESGFLTNFGKYNRLLENQIADFLNVKFALTVPNATTGLQILLSTLSKGSEVLVPSFTFPPTVHAIIHAGLIPVFVDVDRREYNICAKDAISKITKLTSAILAVNVFGNPCSINELEKIAHNHNIKLFFDSAAALGSKYFGQYVGTFGAAEVFSLSATKIVTSGEGGIITTNDKELADKIKCLRNYGFSHDKNDCLYAGFNGKLSELNAILALRSLQAIEHLIGYRKDLAQVYYDKLKSINGIQFQNVLEGCEINYSFFAIEIESEQFGINAPTLQEYLKLFGIETIRYFCPPMHKTKAYEKFNHLKLKNSEDVSQNILCLPMHSNLSYTQVSTICSVVRQIHETIGKKRQDQRKERTPDTIGKNFAESIYHHSNPSLAF
jgi:dTDP-4-amino-4,6-dideoxygalactose transaminase